MRLLVAENDPALATSLHNSFNAEHYAVDLTQNGEEAEPMVCRSSDSRKRSASSSYGEMGQFTAGQSGQITGSSEHGGSGDEVERCAGRKFAGAPYPSHRRRKVSL